MERPVKFLYIQSVPYAADIPGNFYVGRRLFVSGLVPKAAKQFMIDFHAGAELACRLRAVFPLKVYSSPTNIADGPKSQLQKVLRTSRLDDRWGPEEQVGDREFPFKRKQTFDLLIHCGEKTFEVCHCLNRDIGGKTSSETDIRQAELEIISTRFTSDVTTSND